MTTRSTDLPRRPVTTAADLPSSPEPERRGAGSRLLRRVLVTLGSLAVAFMALSVAAQAAVSTFAAHDHGVLQIVIDGEPVDLDQPRFHDLHPQFHIHPGDGNRWHHHPSSLLAVRSFEPMTLGEAFQALDMEATPTAFTLDGGTYDDQDPTTSVSITVNHGPLDPAELVRDDLSILVEVTTEG